MTTLYWVRVPSKVSKKTRQINYEDGGYIVCCPAEIGDNGDFKPIEDFASLKGKCELVDKQLSESIQSDCKSLVAFLDRTSGDGRLLLSSATKERKCRKSSIRDSMNLCEMEVLEESDLSYQIRQRYYHDKIYTWIGAILVAVNPYRELDFVEAGIANVPGIQALKSVPVSDSSIIPFYSNGVSDNFKGLPPHIFAIGARAYEQCTTKKRNQAVIISGESGSGKTVTTKLVLKFLQTVSSEDIKSPTSERIEEKIECTNPILESFGNAKTLRNDNSSRFGKWIKVLFHDGKIMGANIEEYLLEKSRVVSPGPGERNYHIFYMLTAYLKHVGQNPQHPDAWMLSLCEMKEQKANYEYKYLYDKNGDLIDNKHWDDMDQMQRVLDGLKKIGLWKQWKKEIFAVVACVMHLGNIEFEELEGGGEAQVKESSNPIVEHCAKLLDLETNILSKCLIESAIETIASGEKEVIWTKLSVEEARKSRNALAKNLYNQLFAWLVSELSKRLMKGTDPALFSKYRHVGVLDIFGFEDFLEENYFEQLCINYANEELQSIFNAAIFEEEIQTYKAESVPEEIIKQFKVPINHETLHCIKELAFILNEASNRKDLEKEEEKLMQHGVVTMANRFGWAKQQDAKKTKPKTAYSRAYTSEGTSFEKHRFSSYFFIRHYAGKVLYNVKEMVLRNNDKLAKSMNEAVKYSKAVIVQQLFSRGDKSSDKQKRKANKKTSLISKFQSSLRGLSRALAKPTEPHFVRCLKPNSLKKDGVFHTAKVLDQMRCAGLFEAVKIRKNGFPNRIELKEFAQKFSPILPTRQREEAFSACGADEQKKAAKLIQLILAQDGAGDVFPPSRKSSEVDFFAGKHHVLMKTPFYDALLRFRRMAMMSQFQAAIASRDISKLKSICERAEKLDLNFAEARAAKKLLDFLNTEKTYIEVEIPALKAMVNDEEKEPSSIQDLLQRYNEKKKELKRRFSEIYNDIFRRLEAQDVGKVLGGAEDATEYLNTNFGTRVKEEWESLNAVENEMNRVQSIESFFWNLLDKRGRLPQGDNATLIDIEKWEMEIFMVSEKKIGEFMQLDGVWRRRIDVSHILAIRALVLLLKNSIKEQQKEEDDAAAGLDSRPQTTIEQLKMSRCGSNALFERASKEIKWSCNGVQELKGEEDTEVVRKAYLKWKLRLQCLGELVESANILSEENAKQILDQIVQVSEQLKQLLESKGGDVAQINDSEKDVYEFIDEIDIKEYDYEGDGHQTGLTRADGKRREHLEGGGGGKKGGKAPKNLMIPANLPNDRILSRAMKNAIYEGNLHDIASLYVKASGNGSEWMCSRWEYEVCREVHGKYVKTEKVQLRQDWQILSDIYRELVFEYMNSSESRKVRLYQGLVNGTNITFGESANKCVEEEVVAAAVDRGEAYMGDPNINRAYSQAIGMKDKDTNEEDNAAAIDGDGANAPSSSSISGSGAGRRRTSSGDVGGCRIDDGNGCSIM